MIYNIHRRNQKEIKTAPVRGGQSSRGGHRRLVAGQPAQVVVVQALGGPCTFARPHLGAEEI